MAIDITLYTKDYCPYCRRAKALLTAKGISKWTEYDLIEEPNRRREMLERSNGGVTVPQIFIGGQHIGGSDELVALDRAGQLDDLLSLATAA